MYYFINWSLLKPNPKHTWKLWILRRKTLNNSPNNNENLKIQNRSWSNRKKKKTLYNSRFNHELGFQIISPQQLKPQSSRPCIPEQSNLIPWVNKPALNHVHPPKNIGIVRRALDEDTWTLEPLGLAFIGVIKYDNVRLVTLSNNMVTHVQCPIPENMSEGFFVHER